MLIRALNLGPRTSMLTRACLIRAAALQRLRAVCGTRPTPQCPTPTWPFPLSVRADERDAHGWATAGSVLGRCMQEYLHFLLSGRSKKSCWLRTRSSAPTLPHTLPHLPALRHACVQLSKQRIQVPNVVLHLPKQPVALLLKAVSRPLPLQPATQAGRQYRQAVITL